MSEAMNYFTDSYMKRLKRPELFNFNPDQAFGANMVHGSEEQNPWANRDKDNAKYGVLGGSREISNTPAPGGLGSLAASGQQQNPLTGLIGQMAKPVGTYLGKKAYESISDWMTKGPDSAMVSEGYGPMGYGTEAAGHISDIVDQLPVDQAFDAEAGIADAASSAADIGTSSTPYIGSALKAGKDLITGDMFKHPLKSLAGIGGTLGGAALGQALIPIPGVGAVLGALGGNLLSGLFGGGGRKEAPPMKPMETPQGGVMDESKLWEIFQGLKGKGSDSYSDLLNTDYSVW